MCDEYGQENVCVRQSLYRFSRDRYPDSCDIVTRSCDWFRSMLCACLLKITAQIVRDDESFKSRVKIKAARHGFVDIYNYAGIHLGLLSILSLS